jgi:sucrose-6-phosphate hydrolase SacC (GH32 family)
MKIKNCINAGCSLLTLLFSTALMAQSGKTMNEQHRPQVHFSPKAHWVNDP